MIPTICANCGKIINETAPHRYKEFQFCADCWQKIDMDDVIKSKIILDIIHRIEDLPQPDELKSWMVNKGNGYEIAKNQIRNMLLDMYLQLTKEKINE